MRLDKCIQPRVLREPSSQSLALRGITGIGKVKEVVRPPKSRIVRQTDNCSVRAESVGPLSADICTNSNIERNTQ